MRIKTYDINGTHNGYIRTFEEPSLWQHLGIEEMA